MQSLQEALLMFLKDLFRFHRSLLEQESVSAIPWMQRALAVSTKSIKLLLYPVLLELEPIPSILRT